MRVVNIVLSIPSLMVALIMAYPVRAIVVMFVVAFIISKAS